MPRIQYIIFSFCLLKSALLHAQDFSTFNGRREAILKSLSKASLHERGKHGLPKACARLWNNPNDTVATNYITNVLDHPEQSMFDFPGVAVALGKYRKSFKPWQLDSIKADVARLAKADKVNGQGFLGHGTENHATMMWASAYLFAQYFPDAKWVNGWTSEQLKSEMKERMRKTFRNVYQHGYTEYLSTAYEVIMNYPVAILLEFAEDEDMKAIARAFLTYKWSVQALNNFDGQVIAPYARMIGQEDYQPEEYYDFKIPTIYANWLYWGWGENTGSVKLSNFEDQSPTSHVIFCALSDIHPDAFIQNLGSSRTPFTGLSSVSTFGDYGTGAPHNIMRKFYREKQFAMGTGNFRWVPGGDYADHDTNPFNIIWSSGDRFNFINCTHPFWYSDGDVEGRTPDTWFNGGASPFMQTAQHESAAIVLFNIPEKDPWPGLPSAEKWGWRDAHAQKLLKRGMLRYPKSIDEKVENEGWIFLREKDTYIGIKPLKSHYEQTNLSGKGLDGFNIIKSDHAQTGFIFEVGTAEKHGSFSAFRKKLLSNKISVNWQKMTAEYTDSNNNRIYIQYRPGLKIKEGPVPDHLAAKGIKGLAESVPLVKINAVTEIPYEQWPMIQSPHVNMNAGKLAVTDNGKSLIEVDWTGKYPKISQLEEFHSRGGLPNFFQRIHAEKPVRIAYIGGSITAANDGWRDLTFNWFRSNYPLTSFSQTDATIGGTGSDLGVFRMEKDVLAHQPDLVFVEFAVNDFARTPDDIRRSMEGIVRKTWKQFPAADICFVYTIAENVVETMRNGKYQQSAAAMEEVADHYQIPSIHMGVEVIRLLEAGKLVFTGNPDEHPGKVVFTKDKTHPLSLSGHPVYAHAVIRFMKTLEANTGSKPHDMPAPLENDHWESAQMIPLNKLNISGWKALPKDSDIHQKFAKFMPELYESDPEGAVFKVRFKGKILGVYDVIGPKTGIVEVSIDGQKPTEIYRFDAWGDNYRKNSFFLKGLSDGVHEATLRVTGKKFDKSEILKKRNVTITNPADYNGFGWFVNSVLLVGELLE